jgi:hypothetical protein
VARLCVRQPTTDEREGTQRRAPAHDFYCAGQHCPAAVKLLAQIAKAHRSPELSLRRLGGSSCLWCTQR